MEDAGTESSGEMFLEFSAQSPVFIFASQWRSPQGTEQNSQGLLEGAGQTGPTDAAKHLKSSHISCLVTCSAGWPKLSSFCLISSSSGKVFWEGAGNLAEPGPSSELTLSISACSAL